MNHLSRWQLIHRLHGDLWARWHREYLHTLLQRGKWTDSTTQIVLDCLVLLQSEHLSPLKWSVGRIIDVYPGTPGTDGITRVVTVRTTKEVFKRLVNKVCPLPQN